MTIDREIASLTDMVNSATLPAQKEAITAEESLVVVSAGAGTGKTWTLAWRFVWAVATGRARAGEILTLTFTDKAATEMAERIRLLMEGLLPKTKELPTVAAALREGLESLEDSYISTIHSFSSRVIRESGLSLDLDPASRVVSAPEEDLFWSQMTDCLDRLDRRWVGRNLSGEVRDFGIALMEDPMTLELLENYGPSGVVRFARGLMDISSSRGDRPEDLLSWAEELDERHEAVIAPLIAASVEEWRSIHRMWCGPRGILSGLTLGDTKLGIRLAGLRDRWCEDIDEDRYIDFLRDLCEAIKGARGKLADSIASLLPEEKVKDHRESILSRSFIWNLAEEGWSQRELDLTRGLLRLVALCWFCWESRKSGRGLIAFDDMLLHAGRALERNREYAGRFKEVLVDEFQDTNGLQDRLIRSVVSDGDARLFLVGDLKQSIYRFRHADLSLFGSYISKARKGGRYVSLDVSFRTRDVLLDRVNRLFGHIWRDGLGATLHHRYESLRPPVDQPWHGARQDVSVAPWENIILEAGEDEKLSAEDRRDRSASLLAAKLTGMVGEETIWDKAESSARTMRWRDVAILVPSRTLFPSIQRVLGDLWGIPLHFEKNTGYYARTEVQDCVALLRCLFDREDHLALAGYICSPFSGLSLADGSRLLDRSAGKDLSEELRGQYPEIFARLERWREIGLVQGASRVMEELVADGAVLDRFAEWKRRGVAANLRRTVDLLREYESTLGNGLSGAASWLGEALRKRAKEEEAGAVGPDEDVVRVMTVHASKGLEFPVVVVAGCDSNGKGFPSSLMPSAYLGAALSRDDGGNGDPISRKVHRLLEETAEKEESERLFYVACTRARDCLMLSGSWDPPEDSWFDMAIRSGEVDKASDVDGDPPERSIERSLPERGPIVTISGSPGGLERISATSWALYRHCPYGWRLRFRQGLDLTWEQPDGETGGGPDMGSLAHWILARWDFSVDGLEKLLSSERSLLPGDLRPIWGDRETKDRLRGWLVDLISSEEGRKLRPLRDSGYLMREAPFRVPLKDGPLLVGAVDVMWPGDDGAYSIRDYKITLEGGAPEGLYEDQLRFYGLAVTLGMDASSVDMALWRLRERGRSEKVFLSPFEDWEGLAEEIRKDSLEAAAGPWPKREDRCESCPFFRRCRGVDRLSRG
ncbi:UvrD/REP helicase [Dethiosulfovibrio peptidovorans DSM 11002]|uniref:DNA 3'-5' helicase n=1 Tax=Dethiosulfovibrio peptidovorans DSM 11002 TaxID=469381 RepID=D2Z732_9BACT|nr:UvrD-helicase domain-containing protein [Dethiosulfovibrio peptidovorans]EFC91279.1 UvrD/REP helicase [Dethiosulfovibrio peptidovorans DSM 11002]